MKIHVLSDLHLEFSDFDPPETEADVVVLAGDIWYRSRGVSWAERRFPSRDVVYVLGNHEFYGHEFHDVVSACRNASSAPTVHFLENDVVVINGVRFLGAALWTDFAYFGVGAQRASMRHAAAQMTDFRLIEFEDPKAGRRRFAPADCLPLHDRSRSFLKRTLAEPFDGKTVVVTHFLPARGSVAARFERHPLTPCFCSDFGEVISATQPDLWIHGHTHDNCDYRMGRTRVVCNPRGYFPDELNPGFDPELVIEI